MVSIEQTDFSGGIFRGRRAPRNTAYDIVNGLISDEGEIFRRGGSEYKSGSDAGATLTGLWDGHVTGGARTLLWGGSNAYVLGSNDSSLVTLNTNSHIGACVRGVGVGGAVNFTGSSGTLPLLCRYGGSRKTADYSTGTIAVTNGSRIVTGSGTSWSANADAGMILHNGAQDVFGVVQKVNSDTQLTLVSPWTGLTDPSDSYELLRVLEGSLPELVAYDARAGELFIAAVGGLARLLLCTKQRVFFSPAGDPFTFSEDDYHELPTGSQITGATSVQDTAVIFTTGGVWAITNMALDPIDAFGNVQHQVQQISHDVILWGDAGIAARENVLIVPAIDDVYAFALGAEPVPLSASIRPLYREYVEAGYKPGTATVFRGHYILPILESDNDVVTTLVCRLDRGPAWTRWANGASGRAYARRVGSTTREPKLLGLDALRVSDLTGCFDPDSTRKDDADGTDHALEVTTNDYPLNKGLQKGRVIKVRASYSLVDAASDDPTTTMQWSRGPEGSSFITLTNFPSTSPFHAGERDGTGYASWSVGKSAEAMRFKWSTTGAAASATLRKIELIVRPFGKQ